MVSKLTANQFGVDEPGHYDYCRPLKLFTPIKLYHVSHFLLGFAGKALEAIFEYSPREAEQNKWIEWQIGCLRIKRNHGESRNRLAKFQCPLKDQDAYPVDRRGTWKLWSDRPHTLIMIFSCTSVAANYYIMLGIKLMGIAELYLLFQEKSLGISNGFVSIFEWYQVHPVFIAILTYSCLCLLWTIIEVIYK